MPQTFGFTEFPNRFATSALSGACDWDALVNYLKSPREFATKDDQPLVSLCSFGTAVTKNGSLRHDVNVTAVHGVMIDHDAGTMSMEVAKALFEMNSVRAILTTSASHMTQGVPRWRAWLFTSAPYAPAAYGELVGRANAILGGAAAVESFKLSQSYYFGKVQGVLYDCQVAEGTIYIDQVPVSPLYPPSGAAGKVVVSELDWTTEAEEGWRNPPSDAALRLNLADPSKGSARETFGATWATHWLWAGDAAPDQLAEEGKRSEGRMALLTRMMYRNGGNCEQVLRLATLPEHPLLVKDGRHDLLRQEILGARAIFAKWWAQRKESKKVGDGIEQSPDRFGPHLSLDQMFERLVYVGGHTIADLVTGRVWTEPNAIGTYRPCRTDMIEKALAEGKVPPKEEKRWESSLKLWIHDTRRLYADQLSWDPGAGEFCSAPESNASKGYRAFNLWKGLAKLPDPPSNWQEWVALFVDHVTYLVPVESERARFLQWLAHIVQKPGELPHTAYLFVTPTEGTGRGFLADVLARVLPGNVAVGFNVAETLNKTTQYNDRLSQKLLVTVDEASDGQGEMNRSDRCAKLRSLLTESIRNINGKFDRQHVEYNKARWLFFSNNLDALPISNGDRRLIVIANPTEPRAEVYYERLHAALACPELASSVRKYLTDLDLTGFNPGERAPLNDAKRGLIDALRSPVEDAVRQFKAQWPGQAAGSNDLRSYVRQMTDEEKLPGPTAMGHIYRRVGVAVKKTPVRIAGVLERVVGWGDDFEKLDAFKISQAILESRGKFRNAINP